MIFRGKRLSDLQEQDLQRLVNDEVQERDSVEYKRDMYGNSDDDKREMLKDIASMANHRGGYIVVGVEADEVVDHINKATEYYRLGIATGLQSYGDLAQAEIAEANETIDDNRKWIDYAEEDLADCDEAIQEYLAAFQIADTQLGMQLTSKIEEINLSPFRQGIAEAKQLNDDLADAMSE